MTTLDRLLLAWAFGDGTLNWALILVGWRMDAIVLAQLSALPLLLVLLFPARWVAWLVGVLIGLAAALLLLGELASWPFLAEFGTRPGALFLRYLGHPAEVVATLGLGYGLFALFGGLLVVATALWLARRSAAWLRSLSPWRPSRRLLSALVLIPALILAGRSGLGQATPNPGLAVFSDHRLSNELAQDPAYSLVFAAYRLATKDVHLEDYGHLSGEEIIAEVRRAMGLPPRAFTDPEIPTLHRQAPRVHPGRPRNLVIILEESLGADLVGRLGGLGLTPRLERLAGDGLWFQRLYAIGNRTTWGMQALVTGLPPTDPDSPLMKPPGVQGGFFTVAELLRRAGYRTFFLYGGDAHFDDMAAFLAANGVEHIIDRRDFRAPHYLGRWGVSDQDLFQRAHELFQRQDAQGPFAAILLTLSHHRPFDLPPDAPPSQPGETPEQRAARYADQALGEFFDRARQADYFARTVFVITADHQERIQGAGVLPLDQFRIPGLILAPGLPGQVVERVASQLDLLPTALPLLGLPLEHPMIGRDHLTPDHSPGRALIQHNRTLGYLRGDRLVVLRPRQSPLAFRVEGADRLAPHAGPVEAALYREALAHVLFPVWVYHHRAYRLP